MQQNILHGRILLLALANANLRFLKQNIDVIPRESRRKLTVLPMSRVPLRTKTKRVFFSGRFNGLEI
jgi:hypothetical protein